MENWLEDIVMAAITSGLAGWEGWLPVLTPRNRRRLAWLALALAVGAGCGLASALTGMWWPLALYGLGLLAGAAWLRRGRSDRTG